MPSSGCGRQVVAKLSPCVSWLDCWSATFFRIIPATTSRLNCSSRQVVARVCCFLRFCIKPIRYIYHPQLDCCLVAVNGDCSRPCELTLSKNSIEKCIFSDFFTVHQTEKIRKTCCINMKEKIESFKLT